MTRIKEHPTAFMISDKAEEHLKGCTIMEIFSWMDFITYIHTSIIKGVQDGCPAILIHQTQSPPVLQDV